MKEATEFLAERVSSCCILQGYKLSQNSIFSELHPQSLLILRRSCRNSQMKWNGNKNQSVRDVTYMFKARKILIYETEQGIKVITGA